MTFYDDEAEAEVEVDVLDVEPERPPARTRSGHQPPEAEQLLRRVLEQVSTARPMPLSSSVMINREEVVELLEECVARLPDELRAARWLLKEREEFLAKVRREGEDILDQARTRAERMVQRTEVVKAAEGRARQLVERAEDNARRMRLECEDFCDQKLASFEIVLERTQKMVAAGRSKLQGSPISGETPVVGRERPAPVPAPEPEAEPPGLRRARVAPVFDQDE